MVLFYSLYKALSQRGIAKKIQVIAKVRVPIINFVEKKSDVAFDLRNCLKEELQRRFRNDSTRDEKCGLLTSSQHIFLEFASLVFCRACTNPSKIQKARGKVRQAGACCGQDKRESHEGKWSWIINSVNLEHSYDGLFWTLRGNDFSKSGFGPRTVILCDQCEKEYHVGCLKNCKLADLKKLPNGKWFCSTSCKWIYSALQNLLNAVLM
ncbi:hypothetical protein ACS0TY_024005 [Phlomoides rotata]